MTRWQQLAGPAVAAPEVDLTKARDRKVTWRLGGQGDTSTTSDLSFTLPGRHPQAGYVLELATDVHLLRDGVPLYTGRVGGSQDNIADDQHTVPFSSADTRALLGRRNWPDPDTGTTEASFTDYTGDTGALARLLVDTTQGLAGGDLGIDTSSAADTGTVITRRIEGGSPINTELDAAAAFGRPDTGFDWDITPGWENRQLLIWKPQRGTDRGVVLDYTYTGRPRSSIVATLTRQFDPSDYANAVRVIGGVRVETHTETITYTDPATGVDVTETNEVEYRFPTHPAVRTVAADGPQGLWEKRVTDADLVWQNEVEARADAEIVRLQAIQPSYSITLRANAWDGPDHIWLGDTVRLLLRTGRLVEDLQLRVTELALTLGDSGEEQVTLTVGPPRATLLRQIYAMQRRLATRH